MILLCPVCVQQSGILSGKWHGQRNAILPPHVRERAISTIPVLTHPLKLRELPQFADCGAIWQLSGGPHFILRWHTPLCSKVISRLLGSFLISFVLLYPVFSSNQTHPLPIINPRPKWPQWESEAVFICATSVLVVRCGDTVARCGDSVAGWIITVVGVCMEATLWSVMWSVWRHNQSRGHLYRHMKVIHCSGLICNHTG